MVIGVHTPEYSFEHVPSNVEAGAKRLGIGYPVALDSDYTTWNNYDNQSWPADYLIDATGTVRHVGIGEGEYQVTESLIRDLLAAADPNATLPRATQVADQTPTSLNQTGETYLGAARADSFAGDAPLSPGTATFTPPASLPVSGAPNIYTVFHSDQQRHTTLRVTLTPGLSAYAFTFG